MVKKIYFKLLGRSKRKNKRFTAKFWKFDDLGTKIKWYVSFGSPGGSTFIDHNDENKRKNYIARHSKLGEEWNNPFTAGALSYHLLWKYKDLDTAIKQFRKIFNLYQ